MPAEHAYEQILAEVRRGDFGPVPAGEGWLHEDFHLSDKAERFAAARAGGRIGADDVVSASRLYTPEPIVAFILQNTLGALWLQMHPTSPLAAAWPMLIAECVGPPRPARPVRDLTVLDPCCGSGAFLLAAFDMLGQLAADERRAAAAGQVPSSWCLDEVETGPHCVRHALWGADLDPAAVGIARRELADRAGGVEPANIDVVPGPLGTFDPAVWCGRTFDVVCTNPPWVGFRQLDPDVKRQVSAAVPLATSDLAVAMQARCQDLVADDGRVGTVTPAAWLAGRGASTLRGRILDEGGPVCIAQLGQGVFGDAPLVFVAISILARGASPDQVAVLRGEGGSEGEALAALCDRRVMVDRGAISGLPLTPFTPAAPAGLLQLATGAPRRIGDQASTFDGVWTGDNRRDLRYWWELEGDDGWVALSGGQGYQPWVAPVHLRIRAEHVASQARRDGCLEYARVAGGRLGVRLAPAGSAALAGVVTIVPVDDDPRRRAEILAICNGRVGAAWVATLTAGLNFNPGYLAQIPVGSDLPDESLCHAVDTLVALRHEMVARDPSHEGFQDVPSPWRDDLSARLARATMELDVQVGRHLGLASAVADQLPVLVEPRRVLQPHDDLLLVAVLRALGFTWPGAAQKRGTVLTVGDAEDLVAQTLRAALAPADAVDPREWVRRRLATVARGRFRRSPIITVDGDHLRLADRRERGLPAA